MRKKKSSKKSTTRNRELDKVVGANLRRYRIARGMSQEKLGDELGLTFQQVQKYEKGTNSLSASRIPRVCHVLGISLEQLFFGTMGEYKLVDFAQLSSPAIRLAGHIDKLDNNVAARLRGLVDALIPSEEGEGAQA